MSLEAIPLPPPQPSFPEILPDGDPSTAPLDNDPHQKLMEELKSFSAGTKKLRPVGVVNPRSRGHSETAKAPPPSTKIKHEPKKNPITKAAKPSRKKVVKQEESEDESSSEEVEEDESESGDGIQIQDLSKLISGLQQQLNLMAKKSKAKSKQKKKKRKSKIDSTTSSTPEPEPESIKESSIQAIETEEPIIPIYQATPQLKPVEHPIETSAVEEPCIFEVQVSPKTPTVEAKDSPVILTPNKDEILQRRASLRPKSSSSFNYKTMPSPLRRKQEEESSPKYESFVEDFKNFSFKRKVVTNAHRQTSESLSSQPVVNEGILNKAEINNPACKKVFNGKQSSAANSVEKKKVEAIPIQKPEIPLKKETKKEKSIKPKLKVKPAAVEKIKTEIPMQNNENETEEEPTSKLTLDWLIASISPDELLKLQQKLKGKIKSNQSFQAPNEDKATPPPPPPTISTSGQAFPKVDDSRSLLFQQITSFSKAKLKKAGCQTEQQSNPRLSSSSPKSPQEQNPSATLKDALLRRFAALNSDEEEESEEGEASSDSEDSDADEDWSEN
ncbi:hypothetical protein Ocin01_15118 [Orchesella cincta]|uniref:Uncharacterized protein n=1 Tax=Orchesella cincta TaxID=48709 RepID=A0A1D2MEY9_ORCCI|nr:hypothetical protein Ocin01_15118 [Orchesella cincta]